MSRFRTQHAAELYMAEVGDMTESTGFGPTHSLPEMLKRAIALHKGLLQRSDYEDYRRIVQDSLDAFLAIPNRADLGSPHVALEIEARLHHTIAHAMWRMGGVSAHRDHLTPRSSDHNVSIVKRSVTHSIALELLRIRRRVQMVQLPRKWVVVRHEISTSESSSQIRTFSFKVKATTDLLQESIGTAKVLLIASLTLVTCILVFTVAATRDNESGRLTTSNTVEEYTYKKDR